MFVAISGNSIDKGHPQTQDEQEKAKVLALPGQ